MKKHIRSIIAAALCLLVLMGSIASYAHTTSQSGILAKTYMPIYGGYYIGGENVGWSIDEDYHTNGKRQTYRFAANFPDEYKGLVRDAADAWSAVVKFEEDFNNGKCLVETTYVYPIDGGMPYRAKVTGRYADANGHLTSCKLLINLYYPVEISTVTHEFGHVIGLNDLYSNMNRNKIMFGTYEERTVSTPQSLDIWGAKVITGQHSSHNWGYKYHSFDSNGNKHIKYCTQCKGLPHTQVIESCSYDSSGKCIKCGVPQGVQPYSIDEPEILHDHSGISESTGVNDDAVQQNESTLIGITMPDALLPSDSLEQRTGKTVNADNTD